MTLHHVAVEIRREQTEECAAFYELLGFERIEPPPTLVDRAAWLERGGTHVHLLFADEPVAAPMGHLAVVADDYGATLQRLHDAGHETMPGGVHWGSPRIFVRDPAGHVVEVMAFPPGGGA